MPPRHSMPESSRSRAKRRRRRCSGTRRRNIRKLDGPAHVGQYVRARGEIWTMITDEIVNGRKAKVSHLTSAWEPCAPKDADMIKIMFDDGQVAFAIATKGAE